MANARARTMTIRWGRGPVLAAVLLLIPFAVGAQEEEPEQPPIPGQHPIQVVPAPPPGSGPITVAAGEEYARSGWQRFLLGSDWRDLWTTPITLPVLDLGSFAGGLEPFERGGTSQSVVLHMMGEDGQEWHFRSVNKWTHQGLPEGLQLTLAGDLIQDQTSSLHPGGALVLPALLEAVDVLHVEPTFYVMPDDPRLGEFRETFAGMVGMVELKPNEGEDDEPLFAGSRTIARMERLLEHLEEDPGHRANTRSYLTARLVDLLVGDSDRGGDQWRWARYGEEGRYVWEPIPRDRDWAFIAADGLLPRVAALVYPKVGAFDDRYDFTHLTTSSRGQDRRLLSDLERPVWDSIARAVQAAVTDEVIEEAVASMPGPWVEQRGAEMTEALRARRDQLPAVAARFYAMVSGEADVHATDGPDQARIRRLEDGSVEVRLYWPQPRSPLITEAENGRRATDVPDDWSLYYRRLFRPDETEEIRLYLHEGDDQAVVSGSARSSIGVRVIGGEGDDVLVDSSFVGERAGAGTAFHDAEGANRFVTSRHTDVDTRPWEEPEAVDWFQEKRSDEARRDWGSSRGWRPAFDWTDAADLVVGLGHVWTDYDFRRRPFARRVRLDVLVGTGGTGGVGAQLYVEARPVNSPLTFTLEARAVEFGSYRFHGYGNDSPPPEDKERTFVRQDEYELEAAVTWALNDRSGISVGPVARYMDPVWSADDLVVGSGLLGSTGAIGELGLATELVWVDADRRPARRHGFELELGGTAFAPLWDVPEWFGETHAQLFTYWTIPMDVTLALRAGGQKVWGDVFPVQEAAFIGGRRTLRGFRYQRFTGDAAAYGGTELRVPLGEVELLTRGELGVLGLADFGRVWVDGDSPGGWHAGYGAGVWFETLGYAFTVMWARGEQDRVYAEFGLPF